MTISHPRGITFIEFLVTLLIAAMFISLAVPSYYSFIQNNKVVGITNKLAASFNFARMEAIKRGSKISICSASNAALTSCGSTSQWAQGWIVFTDADQNNAIESNNDLLKVHEPLPAGVTVTSNLAIVNYSTSGFLTSGTLTMTIRAQGCTGNNARTLSISNSGRLSISIAAC